MKIDYKELLTKYMKAVIEDEGYSYITSVECTDKEQLTLREIEQSLKKIENEESSQEKWLRLVETRIKDFENIKEGMWFYTYDLPYDLNTKPGKILIQGKLKEEIENNRLFIFPIKINDNIRIAYGRKHESHLVCFTLDKNEEWYICDQYNRKLHKNSFKYFHELIDLYSEVYSTPLIITADYLI